MTARDAAGESGLRLRHQCNTNDRHFLPDQSSGGAPFGGQSPECQETLRIRQEKPPRVSTGQFYRPDRPCDAESKRLLVGQRRLVAVIFRKSFN